MLYKASLWKVRISLLTVELHSSLPHLKSHSPILPCYVIEQFLLVWMELDVAQVYLFSFFYYATLECGASDESGVLRGDDLEGVVTQVFDVAYPAW